jgi:hypothetical protein
MVNVKDKTCEHPECKTQPTFNTEGETKGRFCKEHAPLGMVNVKDKTCEHVGCKTLPTFNTEGETKGRFCKTHAQLGMVNVKDKTCEHPECKTRPNFNNEGETNGRFCKTHAPLGMVNVKDKTCEHVGCKTRPNFGFPGQDKLRCKSHIESGMISNPKRKCVHDKCKEPAMYGIVTPQYCEHHKQDNDINWVEKTCVSCGLTCILNKENKCQYCDPDMYNKTRLAKQNQVKRYLDANEFEYISCDKLVEQGECFKYRPDFLIDCNTHFVVLEIDENQHKDRADECETVRMINIFQSLGMSTKFIRYNPDKYCVNKQRKNPSFGTRMNILKKHLEFAIKDDVVDNISVKYLFFDEKEETMFKKVDYENYGFI